MRLLLFIFCILFQEPSFGLVDQDLSFIDEYDLVKSNVRPRIDDWDVNPSKLDVDKYKFKEQTANTTDWKNLNPLLWLSFREWKNERKFKDTDLEWRKKLRETSYSEKMARVLKCVGVCGNYRGTNWVKSEHLSVIKEGDEFTTEKNSYAWLLFVDGSMVKVSPNTSVTLHEINISRSEILIIMRLNKGYINYLPRVKGQFDVIDRPESDLSFQPLKVLKANREFYLIQDYRKLVTSEKLNFSVEENPGHKSQYKKLNALMEKNDKLFESRNTRFYIYTPNISIEGSNISLDLFYEPNKGGYFYLDNNIKNFKKDDKRTNFKFVYYRGHENRKLDVPQLKSWYEMSPNGKVLTKSSDFLNEFKISKALNARIPSIYLARELWIKKYSEKVLDTKITVKDLAIKHGYRLWDERNDSETFSRLEFVKEYVRRVETTNLISLKKILKKNTGNGFEKSYYAKAMRLHYTSLRNRFNADRIKIREMSDTHYYLWALRNGNK